MCSFSSFSELMIEPGTWHAVNSVLQDHWVNVSVFSLSNCTKIKNVEYVFLLYPYWLYIIVHFRLTHLWGKETIILSLFTEKASWYLQSTAEVMVQCLGMENMTWEMILFPLGKDDWLFLFFYKYTIKYNGVAKICILRDSFNKLEVVEIRMDSEQI